jgi:hypothetical protein
MEGPYDFRSPVPMVFTHLSQMACSKTYVVYNLALACLELETTKSGSKQLGALGGILGQW